MEKIHNLAEHMSTIKKSVPTCGITFIVCAEISAVVGRDSLLYSIKLAIFQFDLRPALLLYCPMLYGQPTQNQHKCQPYTQYGSQWFSSGTVPTVAA